MWQTIHTDSSPAVTKLLVGGAYDRYKSYARHEPLELAIQCDSALHEKLQLAPAPLVLYRESVSVISLVEMVRGQRIDDFRALEQPDLFVVDC